jgi:hypothetical protein
MRAMEVVVRYRDEGVAIGTCGCVVLFAWRGDGTLERVRAAEVIIRAHAEAWPAIVLLHVIEDGVEPPDGEALRTIGVTLDELHPRVVGVAIAFEGGSSWLAMVLDATAAVGAMLRGRIPLKHAVDRAEACLWVQRRCEAAGEPETPTRAELLQALGVLERAIVEP